MERANAFIGSPIQRIEDLRFLKGKGTYVADLARDGALHAAILRSAVAHAPPTLWRLIQAGQQREIPASDRA